MPIFDPVTSKIKMVILTKHGIDNQVWYSRLRYQKLTNEKIIEKMITSFNRDPMKSLTNVVQFYDNQTGRLIEKYKP